MELVQKYTMDDDLIPLVRPKKEARRPAHGRVIGTRIIPYGNVFELYIQFRL